jgi:4'-phosphopantetheinyl transferase
MITVFASPPVLGLENLEPGEVVVYLRRPECDHGALERDLALLDAEERARAARFHFEEDRATYVTSHALRRRVLSRYGAGDAASIRFRSGKHGRPELEGPSSDLSFSLSHTRSLVACGVTRGALLGVDVEQCRRRSYSDLAPACLTEGELAAWRALPELEQEARFVLIWTLKEAYAKALGVGLSLPFQSFGVHVLSEGSAVLEPAPGQSAAEWRFEWLKVEDHYLSIAVRR